MRGKIDRRKGHINYYTPLSLANLVETSDFSIVRKTIFAASAERERIIYGKFVGTAKNTIRRTVKTITGDLAPHLMAHAMAIRAVSNQTKNE